MGHALRWRGGAVKKAAVFQEGMLRGIFRRQRRNTKCSRSGLWSRSALRSRTGIASPHARKSGRGYSDQWNRRPQLRWSSRTRATRRPQARVRCLRSRCRATAERVPVQALSGPMSFLFLRSRSNPRWNPIGSPEDRLDCSQSGQMGAFCEASWARWADERICTGDLPVASLGRHGSGSGLAIKLTG